MSHWQGESWSGPVGAPGYDVVHSALAGPPSMTASVADVVAEADWTSVPITAAATSVTASRAARRRFLRCMFSPLFERPGRRSIAAIRPGLESRSNGNRPSFDAPPSWKGHHVSEARIPEEETIETGEPVDERDPDPSEYDGPDPEADRRGDGAEKIREPDTPRRLLRSFSLDVDPQRNGGATVRSWRSRAGPR